MGCQVGCCKDGDGTPSRESDVLVIKKEAEVDAQKNEVNEDAVTVKRSSGARAETENVPIRKEVDEQKIEAPLKLAKPPEVEPEPVKKAVYVQETEDPFKLSSPPVDTMPLPKSSTEKKEDTQNAATEIAGWKFNVDQAKWASADCQVVQECKFSFDAKAKGNRMLPEEVATKIYKKWVGAKTMWCHNVCIYKGVWGVATVLAEDHGLTFTTTDAIWDFLQAEKPPEAGCCRKCVGRFAGSLSSNILSCKGGLAEHDHDNTCSDKTCLFIKSGLQCPIHQMVPWALKEPEFKTHKRPKSFPPNFSGF